MPSRMPGTSDMIAIALQSGSSGNCIYVESGGTALLFDAGISGIEAARRLALFGRDISRVQAVVISHDHSDHIRFVGAYQRKFGLPVYVTPKTLSAARLKGKPLSDVRFFEPGEEIILGETTVKTFPTRHDGADGAAFVVSSASKRLGILTDLGHASEDLGTVISTLDAVFLESNYDSELLRRGPYPPFLKKRISGAGGHLSNEEAANLLRTYGKGLKWACLAHLSENNNRPGLALETHRRIAGSRLRVYLADRYQASGLLRL